MSKQRFDVWFYIVHNLTKFISIQILQTRFNQTKLTVQSMASTAYSQIKQIIKQAEEPIDKLRQIDLTGVAIQSITPDIKKYLEQMKNLESACLAECSLKSLKNLPDWPKLTDLDISSNALKDEEFKNLKKYPNLVRLNVADNQIQTFDPISTFANMKNLEELDCADNKIEENKDYRKKIYDTIKHLIILDHMDKDGKTVDDEDYEDEEGEGQGEEGQGGDEEGGEEEFEEGSDEQFEEDEQEEESQPQEAKKPAKKRK